MNTDEPAAAPAEPALADKPTADKPPNFLYGPFAGANLKEPSDHNIMIGINAGRHLQTASCSVIIGDNIFGKRGHTKNYISISDVVPAVPDSHLESALVSLHKLLRDDIGKFEKHISSDTLERVVKMCQHMIEVYSARLRIANNNWTIRADTEYIANVAGKGSS